MTARDNRLFDDIARVAGGAAGLLANVRQQVAEEIKARIDEVAERADLVPRADLERVEAMLSALQKRVDALDGKKAPAKAAPVKKTAPKKAAAKKTTTNKKK
jgi:BMFP domain-containing protein YqiC